MKSKKTPTNHLHSRVTYLHQAATYLAQPRSLSDSQPNRRSACSEEAAQQSEHQPKPQVKDACSGLSNRLLLHLRGVSRKGQIRLCPGLKHSICKHCGTLLIPGSTMTSYIENRSRDRIKPWADVLVKQCKVCSCTKRFPVGIKRQPKRADRQKKELRQCLR